MKQIISILWGITLFSSVYGQEEIPGGKSTFEFSIGINAFGPSRKMGKLMTENNFDAPTPNFLYGGTNEHPDYASFGFTARLSYSSCIRTGRKIGFLLNYSNLREVLGYSLIAEHLFVRFSTFSAVIPLFKFELDQNIEFQTGPAIMINRGKETTAGGFKEKYTGPGIGVLSGFALTLWDKRVTYAKLDLQYLLATPNKMGPFIAENWAGMQAAIPENRYNFGHISIGFILGFHFF